MCPWLYDSKKWKKLLNPFSYGANKYKKNYEYGEKK
jgi:hypothetical protein